MKKVLMVMPVMKGGGAERVAALLMNEFHKNGHEAEFILTSSNEADIINRDLNSDIPITVLKGKENAFTKVIFAFLRVLSSVLCKPFEAFGKTVPVNFSYLSFVAQYNHEIKLLRKKLQDNPEATVISFLQPTIPITLFAAKGLPNKIIISERGNPERLLKKRYGYNFIKKYYQRADRVVFQTNDAKSVYPQNISEKGTVIFNPVNDRLPQPYFGKREKFVTTFCRISPEKNLVLLADSFALFSKEFKDYHLKIIGDALNRAEKETMIQLKKYVSKLGIADKTEFISFTPKVHSMIIQDTMYINSSDYEGMSNAMLEAMAIGMPVICTDCPIGGANAVIKNGENGILTEVGNVREMYEAMKKIAADKAFADKISHNAAKIRNELSLEKTAQKWMELF